jgi:hypothetical protein
MPKTAPIHPELRERIGDDIAVGFGRNEIARRYKVSPGLVSKIARERHLSFRNTWMVDTAIHARQVDLWAKREDRQNAILDEILSTTTSRQDGTPTRRYRKLSYQLYNTLRHHNGYYGKKETNGKRHKP